MSDGSFTDDELVAPVRWRVVHATIYDYAAPVLVCHNQIHLAPRDTPRQAIVAHRVEVDPAPARIAEHVDVFGNRVGSFVVEQPHGRLAVTATTEVDVSAAAAPDDDGSRWEDVAALAVGHTGPEGRSLRGMRLDSPLVRRHDAVTAWAAESFPPGRSWRTGLEDLTRRIHRDFAYDPGATTVSTPVEQVFALRRGVCQDFAHLQIACLRALGLPARYVSGYIASGTAAGGDGAALVGADASHAWLSCWGGRAGWVDVDPTNDCLVGGRHVTVAWGRDYGDVCPIKGVYVGGGQHRLHVAVDVRRV